MGLEPANVAALIDVAKDLVAQSKPDIELMLELLDYLPIGGLDMPTRDAVAHAQRVTAATLQRSSVHATAARYALAHVIVLLENQGAMAVQAG